MATYEVTTEKGTYQVDTEEQQVQQEQPQQQPQAQQPNILQQLLQSTKNTIGGIAGGIIQPPTKIVGRAGQAIESMMSGQPPQNYSIPMPELLGGNIPIEQATLPQAVGSVAQTVALGMGGSPALAGAIYGAGMGMEEQKGGSEIAGQAILGGILGKTVATMMGQPLVPKVLKYDNALKRSSTAKVGLDKLRATIGKAKEIAINEVTNVPVETKAIGKNIPNTAIEAIKKPEYRVEFLPDGSIKPTVGNMDKVKDALGEMIGTKTIAWQEATKTAKRQIIKTYFEVRDLMVEGANKVGVDISKPLKAYHDFMINYNKINPALVDKNNQIVANKLKAAFKWNAEPAYKQAWKEVSKASPEVKSVMKSMNKRELLTNILKLTGVGTGLGLAGKGVHSLFKSD